MAQIIHNISFPNDGNGDELRTAFGNQNTMNADLYTNKVDKEVGKGLSTNDYTNAEKIKLAGIEEGAEVNVQADWSQNDDTADDFIKNKPEQLASSVGHFHVAHSGIFSFPQNIDANTPTILVNDGEGDFSTNDFAPNGITNVWDSTTNSLDFSEFSLGDQLAVRVDLRVDTTSANQKIECYILLGEGTDSEYKLSLGREQIKNSTTDLPFQKSVLFSIDNEDWRDTPAYIYFESDDDAVVTVIGWYVPILRKSVNILEVEGGGASWGSITGILANQLDLQNALDNKEDNIGYMPENVANKSTNTSLGTSDTLYPTQNAVKVYADTKLDKVTTVDVDKAYVKLANGTQAMKPISDLNDVLEFANLSAFPTTGETGKIYVALDTNLTYRWSGSAYVQIGGGGNETTFVVYAAHGGVNTSAGVERIASNTAASPLAFLNNAVKSGSTLTGPVDIYPFGRVHETSKVKRLYFRFKWENSSIASDHTIRVYAFDQSVAFTNSITNSRLLYEGLVVKPLAAFANSQTIVYGFNFLDDNLYEGNLLAFTIESTAVIQLREPLLIFSYQ